MSDNPLRYVVHRAPKHELSWCVPGFTARATLAEAISLAKARTSKSAARLYVHRLDAKAYTPVAHVERGRVTLLEVS